MEYNTEKKVLSFKEFLLTESSSLTTLGVPREVMQPIQKDYALSPTVEWTKIPRKKDVIAILKKGEPCLFIQVAVDSIKIFGCVDTIKGTVYYIDKYIYDKGDWGGEYIKSERENPTFTQLNTEIESRANIYQLEGDFTLKSYVDREVRKS